MLRLVEKKQIPILYPWWTHDLLWVLKFLYCLKSKFLDVGIENWQLNRKQPHTNIWQERWKLTLGNIKANILRYGNKLIREQPHTNIWQECWKLTLVNVKANILQYGTKLTREQLHKNIGQKQTYYGTGQIDQRATSHEYLTKTLKTNTRQC